MNFRSLSISMGALALLAMLAGPAAQGQNSQTPRYRVVDLGPLGGTYSQAFYVNSWGVASGQASLADGTWHATIWERGRKKDLGTLGGRDSTGLCADGDG